MRRIGKFLSEVRAEMAKVVWPTRRRTARMTAMVIAVTIAFGLFIGAVDYGLNKGIQYVIDTTQKKSSKTTNSGTGSKNQSVPVNAGGAVPGGAVPVPAPANPSK